MLLGLAIDEMWNGLPLSVRRSSSVSFRKEEGCDGLFGCKIRLIYFGILLLLFTFPFFVFFYYLVSSKLLRPSNKQINK